MKTMRRLALPAALALLAGCGHDSPVKPASAPQQVARAKPPAPAAQAPLPGQRLNFDSVDHYKADVADQIVSRNAAHTFTGQLPPMLPAIVVLRITVNSEGKATEVAVQRSRDRQASAVAMASMQRSGILPRPQNLIRSPSRSISFSETFLFNADYKFQLRTLAGPQ
jgi:protein TonB